MLKRLRSDPSLVRITSMNRLVLFGRVALLLFAPVLLAATFPGDAFRGVAPSSLPRGPMPVASAEYRFPAEDDPIILNNAKTEVWAQAFWPAPLASPAPLVVMLHGNHGTCGVGQNPRHDDTCEYTQTGSCESPAVVTPNHLGYVYLAEQLASYGFFVVSINANRGITCGAGTMGDDGLNLARGRLILKHLKYLNAWSKAGNAPASLGLGATGLLGKIDWNRVGLFGHSRGGEGARAALYYHQHPSEVPPLTIPEMQIRGVFEVGAVDGQTDKILNADGVVWNQLLPMCDGDVSDLQGKRPFERMMGNRAELPLAQKSLTFVWGANHNFFNTEWQLSESNGCTNHDPIFPSEMGSPKQRLVALATVPAFFLAVLGNEQTRAFNQNFNPLYSLPQPVLDTTRIERDMTVSPGEKQTTIWEDFDRETGTNSHGFTNEANGISIEHQNVDRTQRAAMIGWDHGGSSVTFFQSNWTAAGAGQDITGFATLDFRVARRMESGDPRENINFSVQLVDAAQHFSRPIHLKDYVELLGPGNQELTFQTIRVPLSEFVEADLKQARGVRFSFDQSKVGSIFLANLRLSRTLGVGTQANMSRKVDMPYRSAKSFSHFTPYRLGVREIPARFNQIKRLVRIAHAPALRGAPAIEIEVQSQVSFPVQDELPRLRIGNSIFSLSRFPQGQTHRLIFTLPLRAFARIHSGDLMAVQYGKKFIREIWPLGKLNKAALR